MTEWETEELILRSMGNGQYEDYRIVSADEAERRVAELQGELTNYKLGFATANEEREQLEAQLTDSRQLIGLLALAWKESDDWSHRHFTVENCGDYPMVQGTSNQLALRKLAIDKVDSIAVRRAIDEAMQAGREE